MKLITVLLLAFSAVHAQAQEEAFLADLSNEVVSTAGAELAPITETDDHIYISVDGNKMNSVSDVQNLIAKALNQQPVVGKREVALQSILSILGNSANTPKKVDITITSGSVLQEKIGKRGMRELLATLSLAEETNKDDIGISNLAILYWQ